MALDVEMTGSGTIGPIQPGWTVNEFATPVTVGERAGGAGSVNFSARSHPESTLVLNNEVTSIHEGLGSVPGIVRSASVNGINVSVMHDTPLAKFDAERYIPPIIQGSGWSALDLATQVLGEVRLNLGA